jgi:hypothetical protein
MKRKFGIILIIVFSGSILSAATIRVNYLRKGEGGPGGYASVNQTWNDTYTECTVLCRYSGYEACEFYNPGGLEYEGIDVNDIANNIWENNVAPSQGVIICNSGQRVVWNLQNIDDETEKLTLDISID